MAQTKEDQDREKEKAKIDEKPPNTSPGKGEREECGEDPETGEEICEKRSEVD